MENTCIVCGGKLSAVRSLTDGMGPSCRKAYLARIPDEERRFLLSMQGYGYYREVALHSWSVSTPEGANYRVHLDPDRCECPFYEMHRRTHHQCKHIRYVRLREYMSFVARRRS